MNKPPERQGLSLVSLDVGSVNTRAQFFDTVEGRYRFLAAGEAPSTAGAPAFDVTVGALEALDQLQSFLGRTLISAQGFRISPENESGVRTNAVTTTFSGGPALKVIVVGLLGEVSLASVNKLVNSSYSRVVESFSLNDRRKPEIIIDAICRTLPDLIVLAGGTNRGASRSVVRLANYLALALKLIPEQERPQVLFVGNEKLQDEIDNLLGSLTTLHRAPNVRPGLDLEYLGRAKQKLAEVYFNIQSAKLGGLKELRELAEGNFSSSAAAFGRVVRFLGTVIDPPKGVLGIDLGASNTSVASAFAGELQLRVYTELGMGSSLGGMTAETHLSQLMRWIPYDLKEDTVLNYLHNKPLIPQTLPTTPEELAIEQAAARQVMRLAIGKSLALFPPSAIYPLPGTVPWFDRILVSGSAVARAPRQEQSLLMILDAIQPVGIATIILDQNNLVGAVGASAEIDPLLAVQVLESNAFMNLGTVISPVGRARGGMLLRIQMVRDGQKEAVLDIKAGGIQVIPLAMGKVADLYVQPMPNVNIGLGPGRGGWVRRVVGGAFGLIIDGRGRPIQVPAGFHQRQEILQTWQNALGGS
ncbi:MAG TPA: glutamate mutase L [Anaerolineales bacterium]|nr:glutamate mutase L [Anaerolineales bacterium]